MALPRIYADFQNLDDANRLRLTCAGTLQDLARQGIQLQEELVLTFYTDDADDQGQPDELRVEGVVHYDEEGHDWVATIDWNALRHASEEGSSDATQDDAAEPIPPDERRLTPIYKKNGIAMKKTAFVIMPFDEEFDAVYQRFIKDALEEAGFEIIRADDLLNHRNVLQDIVSSIESANLVVADLTASNPNVFYELGIAHALERPTILLTQSVEELPFDLRSYRMLRYQTHFVEIERAKRKLKELAEGAYSGTILFGNPVTDFRARKVHAIVALNEGTSPQRPDGSEAKDDRGFFDHLVDIQDGYSQLTELMAKLTKAANTLTPKTQEFVTRIKKTRDSRGKLAADQIRALCMQYANNLNIYTKELSETNDQYENTMDRIQNSLEFVVTFHRKRSSTESSKIRSFIDTLTVMRESASAAIDAYVTTRDSLAGMLELERTIRRSAEAAMSELGRMVSNISRTISSIDRAIEAAGNGDPS